MQFTAGRGAPPTMSRPALSVLLPTYNSASTVKATLDSVKWADEIVVVDSYSTDETLEICREYGARIIQHEYINSAKQKNWALPQCSHPWVLQVDTDEVITREVREEIEEALANLKPGVNGFRIPFRNYVLGQWMRYGGLYPDYHVRLFRADLGRFFEREVHARVEVPGEIGTFRNDIVHYGMDYLTRQVRNLDRYSRYEANELKKNGRRFHWHDLVLRPFGAFLYRYIWLQGFRDGWRGLIICAYMGFYVFMSRAKLWEMQELRLVKSPC
jgi:glycosyltransferase involved in cell wall biosynthesis